MICPRPDVTVGIPVYNGERYLAEALDSVLAQQGDFNIEVVISDNASTDHSREIAEDYASRYPGIRIVRNQSNIGAARNYRRVLDLAEGRYFKWLAADDRMEPAFLEQTVAAVEQQGFAGVFTDAAQIDEHGAREWTFEEIAPLAPWPAARPEQAGHLLDVLFRDGRPAMVVTMGLFRRDFMTSLPPMGTYYSADWTFALAAALHGRLGYVQEPLLGFRRHPESSSYRGVADPAEQQAFFDPSIQGNLRVRLQHRRRFYEMVKEVALAPLPPRDRLRLVGWYGRAASRRTVWRVGYALGRR